MVATKRPALPALITLDTLPDGNTRARVHPHGTPPERWLYACAGLSRDEARAKAAQWLHGNRHLFRE